MTALLLRRELRRQLPVALAGAALGLLALLILFLGAPLVLRPTQVAELTPFAPQLALVLVGLVTPWLLGVSSLAPDIESGAAAFLGALPVRRERLALARLLVAMALTVAVVAPFGVYALPASPPRLDARELAMSALVLLTIGATPLAAGALAGLVAGRSLPAFAATPLLLLPLGVAAEVVLVGVGRHDPLTGVAGIATIPLLVVGLVLVGVRRGVGVRPGDGLRFGAAGFAALLLVMGGLGGAALAVEGVTRVWHERRWARRGPLLVWQDVRHRPSFPYFSDGEVVAFPPAAGPSWVRGETPTGLRLGPLHTPHDLSPDGRRLLVHEVIGAGEGRYVVVDLTSGEELLRREEGWVDEAPWSPEPGDGFVKHGTRGWRRGVPVCVDAWLDRAGTSLLALDGERLAPPVAGARVTSLRGGWALLAAPDGLHAWDLDAGRCPWRWTASAGRLVGHDLAALLEPGGALRLVRLADGVTTLRVTLGDVACLALDVEPSPDGAAAVVWRQAVDPSDPRDGPLLALGEAVTPLGSHADRRLPIAWSPDGRRVAFAELGVIDVRRPSELRPDGLGRGRPRWGGEQLLGFTDATTLLTELQGTLWAVDVETGLRRQLPHPLPPFER